MSSKSHKRPASRVETSQEIEGIDVTEEKDDTAKPEPRRSLTQEGLIAKLYSQRLRHLVAGAKRKPTGDEISEATEYAERRAREMAG